MHMDLEVHSHTQGILATGVSKALLIPCHIKRDHGGKRHVNMQCCINSCTDAEQVGESLLKYHLVGDPRHHQSPEKPIPLTTQTGHHPSYHAN